MLERLPNDVLCAVLSSLSVAELAAAASVLPLVCRAWRDACRHVAA